MVKSSLCRKERKVGSKKGDIEIGKRMAEEVFRIFATQKQACESIGCRRQNIHHWGTAGTTPSGLHLARLHYCGGDVIYVLTGRRTEK